MTVNAWGTLPSAHPPVHHSAGTQLARAAAGSTKPNPAGRRRPACRFCREPLACSPKPHLQLDAGSGSTRFVAELQLSTDHGRPIFSGYRPTIQLGPEQTRASITLDPPSPPL